MVVRAARLFTRDKMRVHFRRAAQSRLAPTAATLGKRSECTRPSARILFPVRRGFGLQQRFIPEILVEQYARRIFYVRLFQPRPTWSKARLVIRPIWLTIRYKVPKIRWEKRFPSIHIEHLEIRTRNMDRASSWRSCNLYFWSYSSPLFHIHTRSPYLCNEIHDCPATT